MLVVTFLSLLGSVSAFAAEVSRCDKVKAEAAELQALQPVACEESRVTHETYVKAFPEAIELCRKLEAQADAGPAKLVLGTGDEMQKEAMEIRQRHMTERREITDRVIRDLFPTPVDNNDPSRPPPVVSSDCGTEIETHVRFRRNLLRGITEFYTRMERDDDQLLQQAGERALPSNVAAPVKNVR